jgi:Tetratricopeptide repeat
MKRARGRLAPAVLLVLLVPPAALPGCSGSGSARQILETARLEEKQNAPDHARKLYRELVERYAGSPEATEAAARLREIDSPEARPPS